MRVQVSHGIDGLERDARAIPVEFARQAEFEMANLAKQGNRIAKSLAKGTARRHGERYPNAFSWERKGLLRYEYGPDVSKPQGGMSFEFGSRKQPPHFDLKKSAEMIGPKCADAIGDIVDRLFW